MWYSRSTEDQYNPYQLLHKNDLFFPAPFHIKKFYPDILKSVKKKAPSPRFCYQNLSTILIRQSNQHFSEDNVFSGTNSVPLCIPQKEKGCFFNSPEHVLSSAPRPVQQCQLKPGTQFRCSRHSFQTHRKDQLNACH